VNEDTALRESSEARAEALQAGLTGFAQGYFGPKHKFKANPVMLAWGPDPAPFQGTGEEKNVLQVQGEATQLSERLEAAVRQVEAMAAQTSSVTGAGGGEGGEGLEGELCRLEKSAGEGVAVIASLVEAEEMVRSMEAAHDEELEELMGIQGQMKGEQERLVGGTNQVQGDTARLDELGTAHGEAWGIPCL
jgi:hypothetical protein